MGGSCVRWTADTERAFLLALKATGQVKQAAVAIGRSTGACNQRRRNFPAFAAAWDAALAEMEGERLAEAVEAGGTELTVRPLTRARRDGWTQQRQRAFGRALADTGSYGQAAARVGISMTSVQRLRRKSPDFQALCDKALIEGGTTVEEAAYMRAVEGWEEPIVHGGQVIGYKRRFSDTLTKTLLERKDGSPKAGRARRGAAPMTDEEVTATLIKRLDRLHAVKMRQKRAAQLAWCARMESAGWAP